jgi:hypothetical protein
MAHSKNAAAVSPDVVRAVDQKSRITLPKEFANCTVVVERVGDNELRIRKARIVPEDEALAMETSIPPLSERDWNSFIAALDAPPAPNAALKRLMKKRR